MLGVECMFDNFMMAVLPLQLISLVVQFGFAILYFTCGAHVAFVLCPCGTCRASLFLAIFSVLGLYCRLAGKTLNMPVARRWG